MDSSHNITPYPGASVSRQPTSRTALYAFGFNAYEQLKSHSEADIFLPCQIPSEAIGLDGHVLFTSWCETVFASNNHLVRTGVDRGVWVTLTVRGHFDGQFSSAFGDHNGLIGTLDTQGRVYLLHSDIELSLVSEPDSPAVAHVAIAGNGRVAIALVQQSGAHVAHVIEFPSFHSFKVWCTETPRKEHFTKQHTIPGRIKQLIANTTTFACLTVAGVVYTWGDARHRSLGRVTSGQDVPSADDADMVDALGGIKIAKISSGGWMTAALSDDGAAYLWGTGTPGTEDTICNLKGLDSSEVSLLEIIDDQDGTDEPMDVVDVAVGYGHVVLLLDNGDVYTAGANTNGQLGVGKGTLFNVEWEKVTSGSRLRCVAVQAGPKCTFIQTQSKE